MDGLSLKDRKLRLPHGKEDIFAKLLDGQYDYYAPEKPEYLKDGDKQTIRGLRPLMEIPYLNLTEASYGRLTQDLISISERLTRSPHSFSKAALIQMDKLVRNARFGGAQNRLLSNQEALTKIANQLSRAVATIEKSRPLIPEFVRFTDPAARKDRDPCGFKASKLLMSREAFTQGYMHEGKLYHGTPSMESILKIIRNGFLASSDTQGTAIFGYGAYTTPSHSTASGYGTVFEFGLKEGVEPRILDWPTISKDSLMTPYVAEARSSGVDPIRYVSEKCDIDIIVNTHVLVQNSGVIALPKNIRDVLSIPVKNLASEILNTYSDTKFNPEGLSDKIQKLMKYISLADALQSKEILPAGDLQKILTLVQHYLNKKDSPLLLSQRIELLGFNERFGEKKLTSAEKSLIEQTLVSAATHSKQEFMASVSYNARSALKRLNLSFNADQKNQMMEPFFDSCLGNNYAITCQGFAQFFNDHKIVLTEAQAHLILDKVILEMKEKDLSTMLFYISKIKEIGLSLSENHKFELPNFYIQKVIKADPKDFLTYLFAEQVGEWLKIAEVKFDPAQKDLLAAHLSSVLSKPYVGYAARFVLAATPFELTFTPTQKNEIEQGLIANLSYQLVENSELKEYFELLKKLEIRPDLKLVRERVLQIYPRRISADDEDYEGRYILFFSRLKQYIGLTEDQIYGPQTTDPSP